MPKKSTQRKSGISLAKLNRLAKRLILLLIVLGVGYGIFKGIDLLSAGKPGQGVTIQGQTHIRRGAAHPPYKSIPPTSGWHYADATAPWGISESPIDDEVQVHNLEHGGVLIQYKPSGITPGLDEELINKLKGLVERLREEPKYCKLILAPYPGLDTKIALTAWGRIDKFDIEQFDESVEQRIKRFIDAWIDRGPERAAC